MPLPYDQRVEKIGQRILLYILIKREVLWDCATRIKKKESSKSRRKMPQKRYYNGKKKRKQQNKKKKEYYKGTSL